MQPDDTERDVGDEGPSVARLVSDSIAQRRRSGDCCLAVALCTVVPLGVVTALSIRALGGGWVAFLVGLNVFVALPLALLVWLWWVLALDRRVGRCPDCGQMTTFLGPCPTCKRETPGMPVLVNSGCLVALLALLLIGAVVGLYWLSGVILPDKDPGHEPGVWGPP